MQTSSGTKQHSLGRGDLNWWSVERVNNRYGAVNLDTTKERRVGIVKPTSPLVGRRGRLVAVVLEARESSHVGDWALGVYPSRPEVGERVVLGEGTLFVERDDGVTQIGLRPLDGRKELWLDPKALYRVHEQTVELWFEEG